MHATEVAIIREARYRAHRRLERLRNANAIFRNALEKVPKLPSLAAIPESIRDLDSIERLYAQQVRTLLAGGANFGRVSGKSPRQQPSTQAGTMMKSCVSTYEEYKRMIITILVS